MKTRHLRRLALTFATLFTCAQAQTTWDGGATPDNSWGTAGNWDNDTLPLFNGTDSLTVTAGFVGANPILSLGADRNISRITFGGGTAVTTLTLDSGNTLRLNYTSTTAAAGNALWNANTNDGRAAIINSNILLRSGTADTYTGHFRENNNSNGGTTFNGQITQGADENWTLRFTQASSRGRFTLNNALNSFSGLYNQSTVLSNIVGSFGGAVITMHGGITGTQTNDHYTGTNAVSNSINLAAASTWASNVQTRITGAMNQGNQILNFSGASNQLTRLEYSSFSGTGVTSINSAAVSVASMGSLSSGTLNLNSDVNGQGVLILSGTSGNHVPTWTEFRTSRTFDQNGGPNTWRINLAAGRQESAYRAGGFAARGADLVIPHQTDPNAGGITNATFTRNFFLGSAATLDGNRYANNAVIVNTDIAYGTLTVGDRRYFGAAWNAEASKTATSLTLGGPVHELAGVISGENVILYPMGGSGQSATTFGMIRFSNENNALTGTSRWIIGGTRNTFTTIGGGTITGPSNMGDISSVALIFTSDGAFGGATEVQVSSQGSSGTSNSGTLLLEDLNPIGSTTFTRNVNVSNTGGVAAAFGSYAGDVFYTGNLTFAGSAGSYLIHAEGSSTLSFATGAAFTNNNTSATTFSKTGAGTLVIDSLAVGGSQATNNWNVRDGTLMVNSDLGSAITVSDGGTLAGDGAITGNVIVQSGGTYAPGNSPGLLTVNGNLTLQAGSGSVFEIDGTVRGTGYDATDVVGNLTYAGTLTLDFGTVFSNGSYSFDLFDWTGTLGGSFSAVNVAGSYSGSLVNNAGVWTHSDLAGNEWTFTQSDGVLAFSAIPEPGTLLLVGLSTIALVVGLRRRR